MKPVKIDLRKDLPKLQRALPRILRNVGGACEYAQPCAVGIMVPAKDRTKLDGAPFDDTQIDTLIDRGWVDAPAGQKGDLRALQICFDTRDTDGLRHKVAELSRKYLKEDGANA